jgi:hypothetical protein
MLSVKLLGTTPDPDDSLTLAVDGGSATSNPTSAGRHVRRTGVLLGRERCGHRRFVV